MNSGVCVGCLDSGECWICLGHGDFGPGTPPIVCRRCRGTGRCHLCQVGAEDAPDGREQRREMQRVRLPLPVGRALRVAVA